MKNKKTMIVKIDWDKQKVLNENLDFIVSDFIKKGIDFELVLIDAENYVIDSSINTIVNQYIADCKKTSTPLAVDYRAVSKFIENYMMYNKKMATSKTFWVHPQPEEMSIQVVAPTGKSFKVCIPRNSLSDDKIQDLTYLGADYIKGVLSTEIIFNYVLSPFYWFLYQNDLLNDEKYNDLGNYKFGF